MADKKPHTSAGDSRLLFPVDRLLDELAMAGFPRAGVGEHVRFMALVEQFLKKKSGSTSDLKYRLAPLCCHSPEEQDKFYALFDDFTKRCVIVEKEGDGVKRKRKKKRPQTKEPTREEPSIPTTTPTPAATGDLPPSRQVGVRSGPLVLELTFPDDQYRPWSLPELEPALRPLREKEWTNAEDWDVPASIKRSIRAGGVPSFVRRRRRRAPQHLFLIEERSARDHLAALYAELVDELRRRDLDADYYFYDTNPYHCWKTRRNPSTYTNLDRLLSAHTGARLLLIGEPETFLHWPVMYPTDLALALRDNWSAVALLNTRSVTAWATPEEILCRIFPVAPANVAGLGSLLKQWDKRQSLTPYFWRLTNPEPLVPAFNSRTDKPPTPKEVDAAFNTLQMYLGRQGFNWLCATAVYPEIHWLLTKLLHDEAISKTDVPDDTLRHQIWLLVLGRLARLEWFRRGAIPPEYRHALRSALDPRSVVPVRQELLRVLGKPENTPNQDDNSYAAKDRAYTVALLDLEQQLAEPNLSPARRAELEEEFRARIERDNIALSDIAAALGQQELQWLTPPRKDPAAFRVLWVDNHVEKHASTIQTFQNRGIDIQTAHNTDEALTRLSGQNFSLIVSDLGRDGNATAGLDMLQQMRASGLSLPIGIFARYAERYRSQLSEAGATIISERDEDVEKWVLEIFTQWKSAQTIPPVDAPPISGISVLWVDDEPKNNERFQAELNEMVHAVFTNARSTEEALEQLSKKHFEVIISDVSRKRVAQAGADMLRTFREKGITHIPVIFYTTPKMVEQHGGELKELGAAGVFASKRDIQSYLGLRLWEKPQGETQAANTPPEQAYAQTPTKEKAEELMRQGTAALEKGDTEQASGFLQQSLNIWQAIGDRKGEGIMLNNVSMIYKGKGDYDTALAYLQQSLKITQEIMDRQGEAVALSGIGQIYQAKGDYDQALKALNEATSILSSVGDYKNLSEAYYAAGEMEEQRGRMDVAIADYKDAAGAYRMAGDEEGYKRAEEKWKALEPTQKESKKGGPPPTSKTQIDSLLASNKIEEALDLRAIEDADAVPLQARFKNGKRQYNLGMIDLGEWQKIQSQVKSALLNLISSLDSSAPPNKQAKANQPKLSRAEILAKSRATLDNRSTKPKSTRAETQDKAHALRQSGSPSVYISYNHQDSAIVTHIGQILKDNGINVIIDKDDLGPGDSIADFVRNGIQKSNFFLPIVSANSLRSPWVAFDYATFFAKEEKGAKASMLAVRLDDALFDSKFYFDSLAWADIQIKDIEEKIAKVQSLNANFTSFRDELERIENYKAQLDTVLQRLRNIQVVDISGDNFDTGMARVVKAIRSQAGPAMA